MNKASRGTRGPRVAALLFASAALANVAVAQPVPVEVKATQHWVLYARLQGSAPFAVADSARNRLWWFDAQGRPLAVSQSREPPTPSNEVPCDPIGRQGRAVFAPSLSSTDVARLEQRPSTASAR